MALPDNSEMSWPPEDCTDVYRQYELHDAWYSGDPLRLAKVYRAQGQNAYSQDLSFWADAYAQDRSTTLHVPAAGDISSVSASMLFSEPPKISLAESEGQEAGSAAIAAHDRLHEIINKGGIRPALLEAADIASGLGGVFPTIVWDKSVADYPILQVNQPDRAVPEFTFGILTACTFWRELPSDNRDVWRLLERHEPGYILTGLYRGTADKLGSPQPLTVRSETAGYLPVVKTYLTGLTCVYVPNMRPNRRIRGLCLGRSDYSGQETLMESLDQTFSSLMTDLELGMARMLIPDEWVDWQQSDARLSSQFAKLQKYYLRVRAIDGSEGVKAEVYQSAIRADEHAATATLLFERIVSGAGYAKQTFGVDIHGSAESGTALNIRERKSFVTTALKAEYWRPQLEYLFSSMLIVDRVHLGHPESGPFTVNVEMQDSIRSDITDVAPTVSLLSQAMAASKAVLVQMQHPDWSKEQVTAEVDAILEENGLLVPDPNIDPAGAGLA